MDEVITGRTAPWRSGSELQDCAERCSERSSANRGQFQPRSSFSFDPCAEGDERHPASLAKENRDSSGEVCGDRKGN